MLTASGKNQLLNGGPASRQQLGQVPVGFQVPLQLLLVITTPPRGQGFNEQACMAWLQNRVLKWRSDAYCSRSLNQGTFYRDRGVRDKQKVDCVMMRCN